MTAANAGSVGRYASLTFDPLRFAPFITYRDDTAGALRLTAHLDWDNDGVCFVNDTCPSGRPGDANCDGVVNGGDVAAFVQVLLGVQSPCAACAIDLNGDGVIDGVDIPAFVQLVIAP